MMLERCAAIIGYTHSACAKKGGDVIHPLLSKRIGTAGREPVQK